MWECCAIYIYGNVHSTSKRTDPSTLKTGVSHVYKGTVPSTLKTGESPVYKGIVPSTYKGTVPST